MTDQPLEGDTVAAQGGRIGRIPVRNLWLLMLYASDLFRMQGLSHIRLDENPEDIADLVAEILAHAVETRLLRSLSCGYQLREAVLSRVRGRVDSLATEQRQLLQRGLVACRFEELTVNTPRNRLVRAALQKVARLVRSSRLARRCRQSAHALERLGVAGDMPSEKDIIGDRMGHHDAADRFMVEASQLAIELALPTESSGSHWLTQPDREITWVRRLYEKAVGGFFRVALMGTGWRVTTGSFQKWQSTQQTAGGKDILPNMQTDIVLEHAAHGRRIVIDTKFTSLLVGGWYRDDILRSAYVYQIYAYLRSQVGAGNSLADSAAGLLLHPSVGGMHDETVVIQGHPIRFATVDLAATPKEIRAQLLSMIQFPFWG